MSQPSVVLIQDTSPKVTEDLCTSMWCFWAWSMVYYLFRSSWLDTWAESIAKMGVYNSGILSVNAASDSQLFNVISSVSGLLFK